MIEWIDGFVSDIVMKVMFGDQVLQFVDQYFTNQTPAHRVMIVYGLALLSVLGLFVLIKRILKITGKLIKVILLVAIAYYVVVVVMGVDVWGMIFG